MPFLSPLPPSEKTRRKHCRQGNSFCLVLSVSLPGCHSPTIMWSMKFTDGLKRQWNPSLCCIYLYFHGRARLWNWQKNKWHFSWVDNKRAHCISGIYWLYMQGRSGSGSWMRASILTEPKASRLPKLYPCFLSEVFFCYGPLKSDRNQGIPQSLVELASTGHEEARWEMRQRGELPKTREAHALKNFNFYKKS